MSGNVLLLNSYKTEAITLGPKHLRNMLSSEAALLTSVRNLGVFFGQDLSLYTLINHVSKSVFYQLHNVAKVRNFLPQSDAERSVYAFGCSRLDYCNSL